MTNKIRMTALAVVLAIGSLNQAFAQQNAPAQSADDQKLEALLSEADLFYKKSYRESSQRWEYKIAWTENGETTMMTIYLRSIGTYASGDPINVVYVWTQLSGLDEGQQHPPAIIKAVASLNDILPLGSVSAAKWGVFANASIVMKDITAGSLYQTLWQLHYNALFLKKELSGLN